MHKMPNGQHQWRLLHYQNPRPDIIWRKIHMNHRFVIHKCSYYQVCERQRLKCPFFTNNSPCYRNNRLLLLNKKLDEFLNDITSTISCTMFTLADIHMPGVEPESLEDYGPIIRRRHKHYFCSISYRKSLDLHCNFLYY
jgi:hypothetical protein